MDFTCGLVDKFRDLVLDLTWEQLHYLIYYHQNMEQFNEKLEQLTLKRISIQRQKEEAENNVEQIEEEVQRWLNKVDEIWEKVQMLLEKSRDKTECRIMSCPNPWLRYKLSKRAKAMAHEISEIFANANFNRVAHRVLPPSLVQLPNIVNNEGIDSRVQIKRQIIEALQDPSVKVVGLCGLGGVGKTTIAKDVTKEEEIQKKFDKVIMATVSQEMNIGQIQDQIIDKLGMKLDVRTEEVKAFHLSERLKQEKNMLLILDDLWEELELGKVGIPFVDVDQNSKNKGCKILLTSRHLALLSNRMKCQEIIKVGFLSEDEAWELFNRIVGVSIDSSIESIATEIVQKCGGLPLAIATAAKALKDQNIEGWEDYLARLKHPLKRTITGIKEVDNILRLSYDDLSEERKQIFLLAAMMSHDPLIEDLLMYSVGLDILEHAETMAHAHGVIFDVVRKLKSLNLFLDSFSMHRFTIHDVYRDLALSIASHEFKAVIVRNRRLNEWPDEDKLEHCRGICLQESDIGDLPEKLHGPMLELFLLDSDEVDLAIPDLFFESSKQLKLLALTKVHFSSLTSLRFLEKLKALCLHSCVLEDITEVGRLRKLKVLSLAHSKIERLPIELKNLTSLQFLNLSHCSNLIVIPPKLLSSLKKLEVLYMIGSFDQWNIEESNDEADKNASLNELTNLPISCLDIRIPNVSMLPENLFFDTKLKKYKILIGKRWEWRQVNDKTSKILRLELESSIQLTVVIQKLLLGVEDLYLYGSNGQENVLLSHDGRGFPCLKHLHIESNDNIKSIVLKSTNQEVAFPILESLKLKNLKALENLCEGTNALDFCQVLFPNLEILEFSNLNSMIALTWNDQLPHSSFSNLKTFTVNRCGFVTLVPLHVLKCLNKLEELEVRKCEVLETVFDYENLNDFEEIVPSSMVVPLKKLKLSSLQKLKDVWSNHYCQGNVSFPSLRSVEVSFCKSLTSIFPASIAKDMLRNLEELRIGYCGVDVIVAKDQGLQSVDVTFEFPRLTSLTLYSLQKLRNFYPQGHTLKCTNLQPLYIESCDELEIFEKEVSSSVEMLEDETTPDSKYPLLSHIKVDKLEELKLKGIEAEMIGSGRFPMYYFPDVKLLSLCADTAMMASYKCPQFKIFSPGINHTPCLRSVQLSQDYSGKHHEIWDTDLNKTFYQQRFFASRELVLDEDDASMIRHDQFPEECCPKVEILGIKGFVDGWVTFPYTLLERFLKLNELLVENGSFEEIFPSYALSSTSFHNLTVLKVSKCHQLVYLMGYSIAESLVNLETLDIDDCKKMKEIVRKNTNEDVGEIVFHGLRILKLTHLPTLKTTDDRKDFNTEDRAANTGCTNISKSLFNHNKVLLPKLEKLELSDLLNNLISLIWDDQLLHKSFNNLKTLNVERCGFMRFVPLHVLNSLNNLEKLKVKFCNKLEMVFGYYKEMESSSAVMPLNLTHLEVEFCRGLTTLMTSSAAQGLVHLTHLSVTYCNQIEEIIIKDEGGDDEDKEILFTEMKFLKLFGLPRLKRFSGHGCTLKFPLLDQLIMTGCPKFKIFSPGLVDTPFLKSVQLSKGWGECHEILDTNLNKTF